MNHILKNIHLKIYVDLPDEGYINSRFDWTGKIKAVEYNGKPNIAIPRIAKMLNPVYDYVQVVPSLISLTHYLVCSFLRLGTSIEIQKTNTKERYSL